MQASSENNQILFFICITTEYLVDGIDELEDHITKGYFWELTVRLQAKIIFPIHVVD
jgi:hypothetical protein